MQRQALGFHHCWGGYKGGQREAFSCLLSAPGVSKLLHALSGWVMREFIISSQVKRCCFLSGLDFSGLPVFRSQGLDVGIHFTQTSNEMVSLYVIMNVCYYPRVYVMFAAQCPKYIFGFLNSSGVSLNRWSSQFFCYSLGGNTISKILSLEKLLSLSLNLFLFLPVAEIRYLLGKTK